MVCKSIQDTEYNSKYDNDIEAMQSIRQRQLRNASRHRSRKHSDRSSSQDSAHLRDLPGRGHPRVRRRRVPREVELLQRRIRPSAQAHAHHAHPRAAPTVARAPAPHARALRLGRDGLARIAALAELEVLDVPAQLHVQDAVLHGLLARADEDLALAERRGGEHDQYEPHEAHPDRHHDVPHVEELVAVEGVADLSQSEDPAH